MEQFKDLARWLITIGLVMLLILLRLEAEKFGTAEYYEATRDGERPRLRRRITWYGPGLPIVIAILFVHPSPQAGPVPRVGRPDPGRGRRHRLRPVRRPRGGQLRDVPLPPDPVP